MLFSTCVRSALALALLATGCDALGGGDDPNLAGREPSTTVVVQEGTVLIRNIDYNPPRLRVPVGKEVVWRFDGNGVGHTVTADDGSFDSGRQTTGEFRHVFDRPGEVRYHCEIHARMKGVVVVGPPSEPAPSAP